MESLLAYKLQLRAGPMPNHRWPTRNELSVVLGGYFCLNALDGHILILHICCLCIIVSNFVSLRDSCVCDCLCLSMWFLSFSIIPLHTQTHSFVFPTQRIPILNEFPGAAAAAGPGTPTCARIRAMLCVTGWKWWPCWPHLSCSETSVLFNRKQRAIKGLTSRVT